MTADDAVHTGRAEIGQLGCRRRRGEVERVDVVQAAMHDGEANPAEDDVETARQGRHPGPPAGIDQTVRKRVPCGTQLIAAPSGAKPHPQSPAPLAKDSSTIAHDDVNARVTDGIDGSDRVGAVGDDVTCADDPLWRDAEAPGVFENGTRRLEISIRPTEDKHRMVGSDRRRYAHTR